MLFMQFSVMTYIAKLRTENREEKVRKNGEKYCK